MQSPGLGLPLLQKVHIVLQILTRNKSFILFIYKPANVPMLQRDKKLNFLNLLLYKPFSQNTIIDYWIDLKGFYIYIYIYIYIYTYT